MIKMNHAKQRGRYRKAAIRSGVFGLALVSGVANGENTSITVMGNVSLTSDYVFRGVSHSDEGPALQGGVDVFTDRGTYAGAWLSSVDKPWGGVYSQVGDEEDIEFDVYLGHQKEFQIGKYTVTGDAGLIHYGFAPDPDGVSWSEVYLGFGIGGLTAKVSAEIQGAPMGTYYEARYDGSVRNWFNYSAHVGHSRLDRNTRGFDRYTDFSIGVSKVYRDLDFSLTYFRNDKNGAARFLRLGDDRFVFSVGTQRTLKELQIGRQ